MTLSLENDVNVASKSNKQKNVEKNAVILKVTNENTTFRVPESDPDQKYGSGSVAKCHGSTTLVGGCLLDEVKTTASKDAFKRSSIKKSCWKI
jgi:hypothetical protein